MKQKNPLFQLDKIIETKLKSVSRIKACRFTCIKTPINEFTQAEFTDEAIALMSQAKPGQSFVYFIEFNEKIKQLDIRVYPTCSYGQVKLKTNKNGEPFTYKGKTYPVIEGEEIKVQQQPIRIRTGRIHVIAAKELGISEDGISNGRTGAGGVIEGIFRNKSTSQNKFTFTWNPIFLYLYFASRATIEDFERELPSHVSKLVREKFTQFLSLSASHAWMSETLEEEEHEFEQLSDEEISFKLEEKLSEDIKKQNKNVTVENIIIHCLEAKIPININKIIFLSIKADNAKILRSIILRFPDCIHAKNEAGKSLLDYAVSVRSAKILDQLFQLKIEIKSLEDPTQALFLALEHKPLNLDLVDALTKIHRINLHAKDAAGNTLLHCAIKLSNKELTNRLMKLDIPKILIKEELYTAVRNKYKFEIIKDLISYASSEILNMPDDKEKKTILDFAVEIGSLKLVNYIISNKIIKNEDLICKSLWRAILSVPETDSEIMKSLIMESKNFINRKDELGRTPLHLVAYFENNQTLRLLLEGGANPKIKDNMGLSPKQFAENVANNSACSIFEEFTKVKSKQSGKLALSMTQTFFNEAKLDGRDETLISFSSEEWDSLQKKAGWETEKITDLGYTPSSSTSSHRSQAG